jgi:hypothetical protein
MLDAIKPDEHLFTGKSLPRSSAQNLMHGASCHGPGLVR